ncbi:coxsackievirus and adenovirus receptor homolog [Mastacembelus armatus]|uniref:coxsackievirus and adenovirus receptor homolog n=1 Tax=Mastacembelus armatus TaxID=205130 RepID=UPI000E4605C8|nr:coxsackievirus and adenovirus receptor homolog [Mastacembelus armatus]
MAFLDAVGDSVTLRCHFNLAPEDLGVLDIEWSIKPSDVREEETLVIWYAGNHIYDGYDPFRGRVQFVSPDPASGNASISITDLTPTDHNTYQCKVRKLPGISMINMDLNVMERPTEPECNLEGVVDLGHKVVLRCRSTQGSSPMWYSWYKESRNKMLPNDGYVSSVQGDLFLTVTKENILGTYICTAQNLVGMDTCRLTLKFSSAVRIRVAAAAAGTALITIIIIAIIIFCHHKRKIELHLGCEIIEDEMPPHQWLPKKSQQVIPSRSVLKEEFKNKMLENKNDKKSEKDSEYVDMTSKQWMEEFKNKMLENKNDKKSEKDSEYVDMTSKQWMEEFKNKMLENKNDKKSEEDSGYMDMISQLYVSTSKQEETKKKMLENNSKKSEEDNLYDIPVEPGQMSEEDNLYEISFDPGQK